MNKKKIDWIKVCVAPRLIKLDYEDTIKKSYNYIFAIQELNVVDSTGWEFYNIGLYKQDSWYPINKNDLWEILDYIKTKKNIQVINVSNSDDDKLKQACELWRLIEQWFSLWEVEDEEIRRYTVEEVKRRKECETKIGDIVEKYPDLEELIPYPIQWR